MNHCCSIQLSWFWGLCYQDTHKFLRHFSSWLFSWFRTHFEWVSFWVFWYLKMVIVRQLFYREFWGRLLFWWLHPCLCRQYRTLQFLPVFRRCNICQFWTFKGFCFSFNSQDSWIKGFEWGYVRVTFFIDFNTY